MGKINLTRSYCHVCQDETLFKKYKPKKDWSDSIMNIVVVVMSGGLYLLFILVDVLFEKKDSYYCQSCGYEKGTKVKVKKISDLSHADSCTYEVQEFLYRWAGRKVTVESHRDERIFISEDIRPSVYLISEELECICASSRIILSKDNFEI